MKFIDLQFDHLLGLDVIPDQHSDWCALMLTPEDTQRFLDRGENLTLVEGSQLIACMGFMPYLSGLAAWIFIDKSAQSRPIAFARSVRRRLQERARAYEAPVYGHAATDLQSKWLRMLGFEFDGTSEFTYDRYLLRMDRDRASAA